MSGNIDFFTHVLPKRYLSELDKRKINHHPSPPASILSDPIERTGVMDEVAPGDTFVITLMGPDLESMTDSPSATDLAALANDEMAALVRDFPNHFIAAAATLPMADIGGGACRRTAGR